MKVGDMSAALHRLGIRQSTYIMPKCIPKHLGLQLLWLGYTWVYSLLLGLSSEILAVLGCEEHARLRVVRVRSGPGSWSCKEELRWRHSVVFCHLLSRLFGHGAQHPFWIRARWTTKAAVIGVLVDSWFLKMQHLVWGKAQVWCLTPRFCWWNPRLFCGMSSTACHKSLARCDNDVSFETEALFTTS